MILQSRTPLEVLKSLKNQSFNDIVRLHYSDTQQEIQFQQRALQEIFVAEDVTYNGITQFVKALDKTTVDDLVKHLAVEEHKLRLQLAKNLVNKIDDLVCDSQTHDLI